MKRAGRHAIGLAALLCLPALLGAQVVIYTENWNSGAAWNLESGYYLAYNNLLTDNGDSDTTIPAHLRYHSDMPTQDYSVQSAMSCATFWPDQYHGYQTMVYHYLRDNGSNTWYEVQYEMGAVWLNKVQSGSRTYLAYYYGGTYTCGPLLSAIAGGTITVSLNGTQMISYTDPSPITSGRPGVGTMNTNPFTGI